MNIKVGDIMEIHCYKHDGSLYKTFDKSVVLDIKKDYIVVANENVLVTKRNSNSWRTKEPAILFFYYNRWFNVIAQLKSRGLYYYCNISSPFVIDNNIIKFIDYDLDLRVFANGAFKILDRNEYNYNKKVMKYSKDINYIVHKELSNLIQMKKDGFGPFNKSVIDEYYKMYKDIKNV